MEVFVNECSFHEQFQTRKDFKYAVRVFYTVLNELYKKRIQHKTFWDENLFYVYKALRNKVFISSLNSIPDKSLCQALMNILNNKLNAKDWRQECQHSSSDQFTCDNESVTDTSMAELAERKIQNTDLLGFLVNFPKSKFEKNLLVVIIKNQNTEKPINLDCIEDKDTLENWLESKFQLSTFVYDYASTVPPTDKQTVLTDTGRFRAISLPFQSGRKVYLELKTNYYWYVDNRYQGRASHLEVFDSQGRHIGEASLDGTVNLNKQDLRKRLET